MRRERSRPGLVIVAVALGFGSGPAAADPAPDEFAHWIPSLSIELGAHLQGCDGQVASTVRPSADGDDVFVVALPGGGVELMSPSFGDLPGRPRAFIGASAYFAPEVEHSVGREGSPSTPDIPDPIPDLFQADFLGSHGSDVTAFIRPLVWTVGAGVAFTLHAGGRNLKLKSSVEYLQEEMEFQGFVSHVEGLGPDGTQPFVVTRLLATDTETYRAVGPRLAVELDVVQTGQLGISVFAQAAAFWFLGDREVRFGATDGAESGSFGFEKDPMAFQGGVGVRFSWRPF